MEDRLLTWQKFQWESVLYLLPTSPLLYTSSTPLPWHYIPVLFTPSAPSYFFWYTPYTWSRVWDRRGWGEKPGKWVVDCIKSQPRHSHKSCRRVSNNKPHFVYWLWAERVVIWIAWFLTLTFHHAQSSASLGAYHWALTNMSWILLSTTGSHLWNVIIANC